MPTPEEFKKLIDKAAQKRGLNEKQIKALYVLNGVENKSGTNTERSYANTSADRIRKVFGPGSIIGKLSNTEIDELKKDDKKFFDKAYGDKLDNEGEGYKYRGRGGVQLTGKSNYKKLTDILNKNGVDIDLVANPELATDPRYSADILVAFADKEGMFTEGSDKYLSNEDLDALAQGDANAIDKLHNITNSKAGNENITKTVKKVYNFDKKDKELTKEEKQLESYQNIQDEFPDGEYGRGGDVYILPDGKIYSYDGKFGTYDRELKRPKWTHNSYTADKNWKGTPGYEERQAKKDKIAAKDAEITAKKQADIDKYGKKGTLITEGKNRGGTRYSDSHYVDIYGGDVYEGRYTLSDEEKAEQNKKEEGVNIQDLTEPESTTTTGTIKEGDSREDIEKRIQGNKDILNNLGNRKEFEYESKTEWGNDLAGSIMDAGRGVVGMIGANKKVPVYERGSMFQTSMNELTQRRNMGLTNNEKDFARNMAERGYGYDVKNIAKFAGGSAGVALGGLGRATGQLYDQYGEIAVRDEGVRRQNRADFNRGALSDEQVNRQIFTDELRQTEMTKQAGAGLFQDATKNIIDRSQYNRAYGPGSQMYQYNEGLIEEKERSIYDQEQADARRVEDIGNTAKTSVEDDSKLLQEKYGTLNEETLLGEAPIETEGYKTEVELEKLKNEGKIDEDTYQTRMNVLQDTQAKSGIVDSINDEYIAAAEANFTGNESTNEVIPTENVVAEESLTNNVSNQSENIEMTREIALSKLGITEENLAKLDDNSKKQVYDRLATMGIGSNVSNVEEVVTPDEVTNDVSVVNESVTEDDMIEAKANGLDLIDTESLSGRELDKAEMENRLRVAKNKSESKSDSESGFDAASFSDETEPEDNIKDYEAELGQNAETLKKYKENPIAFLEDDIRGWESEPDSKKKTKSLKNLKKNLKYLKSLKKK